MQTLYFDIQKQRFHVDLCNLIEQKRLLVALQESHGITFELTISDCDEEYQIPGDASFEVWFCGCSGKGAYATVGDHSAVLVSDNVITVELAPEVVAVSGPGMLSVIIKIPDEGSREISLGLQAIPYMVRRMPDLGMNETVTYD